MIKKQNKTKKLLTGFGKWIDLKNLSFFYGLVNFYLHSKASLIILKS